jgi:hypothetical protein
MSAKWVYAPGQLIAGVPDDDSDWLASLSVEKILRLEGMLVYTDEGPDRIDGIVAEWRAALVAQGWSA